MKLWQMWSRFARISETPNRSTRELGCLRMCNQIALAVAMLVELYAPLYWVKGYQTVALFNGLAGILILAIIPLNRSTGRPLLGRNLFLLINNACLVIYCLIFGRNCWPHLFFLNMMTVPHIVFPPQRILYIRLWSLVPPVLFFGLEFWGFARFADLVILTPDAQRGVYLLLSPSVFIIALLYTHHLYRLLNRHEDELLQRISELQTSTQLIKEQQMHLATATHYSAIAELSAGVAHEINNPLAIIRGYAEQLEILARRNEDTVGRVPAIAQNIKLTVDRITRITLSLRNLSREGGDDPFEDADLVTIVSDVLAICREGLLHEGIEVRVDLGSDAAVCACRPVQIAQVLLNLIHNAKDAVETQTEKWIAIRLKRQQEQWEIDVVDSGPGIKPEILPRIHQPFFTTKPPGKGTGLGLSLSRKILLAHRGLLFVDTGAAHTTFVLQLPASPQPGRALGPLVSGTP